MKITKIELVDVEPIDLPHVKRFGGLVYKVFIAGAEKHPVDIQVEKLDNKSFWFEPTTQTSGNDLNAVVREYYEFMADYEAYCYACELDSPNSPEHQGLKNAKEQELLDLYGIDD